MVGPAAAPTSETTATSETTSPPESPARKPALSPSRASDFLTCPLRYRFRVIDKIPEQPSRDAVRGTVVHGVLEELFGLPATDRTVEEALRLLRPQWETLLEATPELAALFTTDDGSVDAAGVDVFLDEVRSLVQRYFTLEDPTILNPAERELHVECELESGLRLHGYVDRLDVAADGAIRVVDYKTGKAPRQAYEQRALFQMRFYALVLWRLRGVVPRMLQLIYLGSGEVLRYTPDEHDLRAIERKLAALWTAIERARTTGDWRASPGPLCEWCDHKARCPAWGGTPPPLPDPEASDAPDTDADAPGPRTPAIDL